MIGISSCGVKGVNCKEKDPLPKEKVHKFVSWPLSAPIGVLNVIYAPHRSTRDQ